MPQPNSEGIPYPTPELQASAPEILLRCLPKGVRQRQESTVAGPMQHPFWRTRQKIEATSEIVGDFDLCMQQLNHPPLGQVGLAEAAPAGPIFCRLVFRISALSSQ